MAVVNRASPLGGASVEPAVPQVADVIVVGAGVIGLSVALGAARSGMDVVVADPEPARGASWVAAGMLAPVTELHYGEEALLELNLAAARRWDAFAAELAALSGPVGYRRTGTLLVAYDDDDRAWAEELFAFQHKLGLEVQWMDSRRTRQMEGAVAPGIRAGVWAPGDHQVHNRQLLAALLRAVAAVGVRMVHQSASAVECSAGTLSGVRLSSGALVRAPAAVLAAGCRSAQVGGIPPQAAPSVRPVKGQILRLRPRSGGPVLWRSVRAVVEGSSVYLVPREDGSVVVGATVEEQGFDTDVTAGAVYELLRDARRVVPAVSEMVLDEASAGLRPGSPDNGPLVGASPAVRGLVLATGHYRHGILLAPITAQAVLSVLSGGDVPAELAPFAPGRFASAAR